MILDTIENLAKYCPLNPRFKQVCEFIQSTNLAALSNGRHEICGDELFVNIMELSPKGKEDAPIETHNEMTDIQIVISGVEGHGHISRAHLPLADYNRKDDISFYPGEAENYFTLTPGYFVIYFPEDGHAPGICDDKLRKAIFKVKNK